jgi:hypothetical protein
MQILNKDNGTGGYNKLAFYLFLLLYSVALLYLCQHLNVWVDETYTLNTTSRNLKVVINQAYNFEGQPPVYFVLLSIWRYINSGVFFARLFSICCVGTAAFIFNRLVNLVSTNVSSKWMVVIFLLNPFTVWAAMEIRLYAFVLLLSVTALYYFFLFYTSNKNKYLYFFLAVCLVGLYTQYFFSLLIAAMSFSLLVFKGWKACFRFCLYLIPVVLLFLPNFFFLQEQVRLGQTEKIDYSLSEKFILAIHSPQNLMLSLQIVPLQKKLRWAITLLFFVTTLYTYYKWYKEAGQKKEPYFKKINIVIVSAAVFVLLLSIVVTVVGVDYQDRYLTIVFPLFILIFTLLGIYAFIKQSVIFAVIAGFYLTVLSFNYSGMVKQYDFKAIAKYLNTVERPAEPILVYHGTVSLSLNYYYKGANKIVPLPHEIEYNSNTFLGEIKDTVELKRSMEKTPSTTGSYLLITDLAEQKYADDPARKIINDYLNSHYTISFDTLFFGKSNERPLRIRRLETMK